MILPTGKVTFLFTDIEGSTRLWEEHTEAMRVALARHDALLREAIEGCGGVVFKTMGDAFCAAFSEPLSALEAASLAQQALIAEAWSEGITLRVRMALHTGIVETRDNDYFGPPVNRVARLLGLGHGGQVLLSMAVQELVAASLPAGCALLSHGEHRLKDLTYPEQVYQLMVAGLPESFPALRSLNARPNNLPQQLTSFIGRDQELGQVKSLLGKARLLTITGSGGCGKTRLALQTAADILEAHSDGVWLIRLETLTDGGLLANEVAAALGLREGSGRSVLDLIVQHLRSKTLVLLLDNCEHVVDASAGLSARLLEACPNVRILATSREPLRIPGEEVYRVPPLLQPDPQHLRSEKKDLVAAVMDCDAVQLFVDRARAQRSDFVLDDRAAIAVAQVCHRLDGIPLAIELAAARTRSLSVHEINDRLDQRFRLLTTGSRTALPRQQTLRSLIDWSYDLLTEGERALLVRLSVFSGGWMLDAAEQICSGEPVEDWEVLDLLSSLADKSLVTVTDRSGKTRYGLLESLRQYARDRLAESSVGGGGGAGGGPSGGGTGGGDWRDRHVAYYLALAEEAEPHLTGPDQVAWTERLEEEHDNLRAALRQCVEAPGGDERGLRLAGALWRFWSRRSHFAEGRGWLSSVLTADASGAVTMARAKALGGAGSLADGQSDYGAARQLHEESLAMKRQLGDEEGASATLNNLGLNAMYRGDLSDARRLLQESIAIRRRLGHRWGYATGLINLGIVAKEQGDYAGARSMYEESLLLLREIGDQTAVAGALSSLGQVAMAQGDYVASYAYLKDCLDRYEGLGDRMNAAMTMCNLGNLEFYRANYAAAEALYNDSITVSRELGNQGLTANTLTSLANVALMEGDSYTAHVRFGEAIVICRDIGAMSAMVDVLMGLASASIGRVHPLWTARMFGAEAHLREDMGAAIQSNELPRYQADAARAHAAAGDDAAFDAAWQAGHKMTLEEAIEHALSWKPDAT